MSIEFKAGAVNGLRSFLEDAAREHMAMAADAAEELGEKILRDARALAPIKSGKLRKSGKLLAAKPRKGRKKIPTFHKIKIRFGSKRKAGKRSKRTADYAAIVHFDPHAHHTTGTDRFLWIAVERHAGKLPAVISRHWNARAKRFDSAYWKAR